MNILIAGLSAGYLVYVLTVSHARPDWWAHFQNWWRTVAAPAAWNGKPFTCAVCMSFWMAGLTSSLHWIGRRPISMPIVLLEWLAATAISLLLVMIMGWLRKD